MKPFFNVQTVEQVLDRTTGIPVLPGEQTGLASALGRSLASALESPMDLPGFRRSTMDGYAVRAKDTFGATETSPGYLDLTGEVPMGQAPDFVVGNGQCAHIATGGMLPEGADAVVMVEHTRTAGGDLVEVAKSVAPGSNTLGPTDDAAKGQVMLEAGSVLRPQDIGLMAALGMEETRVVRRPKVGIISTGDEVVPISAAPGPGQVRDVNTYTLAAQIRQCGGQAVIQGLAGDDEALLKELVARSLEQCDLTLLSGGSSVGARDLTAQVFMDFDGAELLVHGVSVSPGKPFIWVRADKGHLLGLPGQVASCMITFHLFVEPMMERMLGRPGRPFARFGRLPARLSRNLPSAQGREDYIRVKISPNGDGWLAEPLFGKSGLITTLTQGDGLIKIPLNTEGMLEGQAATVLTFP